MAIMLPSVFLQLLQLLRWLVRQPRRGPDLPVRVRVRAAHGCALVLEDLHPAILRVGHRDVVAGGRKHGGLRDGSERRFGGQVRGVDLCPCFDYGHDLGGRKVGEGEVMGWGEGKHVAFSCDRDGAEEYA